MVRIVRIVIALVVLASVPSIGAGEVPPLPLEAVKAIEAHDWNATLKLLASAAKDPANEPANYWTGVACYETGKTSSAVDHLSRALKANPFNRAAAVLLARCHDHLTMWGRVRGHVFEAQKAFPFDGEIAYCVGRAWMKSYSHRSGSYKAATARERRQWLTSAIHYFRRAELLGWQRAENARWLAVALMHRGDYDESLQAIRLARQRGAISWDVFVVEAECLNRLGRYRQADRMYQIAAGIAPAHRGQIAMAQGKVFCRLGLYNEALDTLRRVFDLDWGRFYLRHWYGRAALGAKDYRRALWGFRDSYQADGFVDDVYWVGRCAYALGRYTDSEALFLEAARQDRGRREARGERNVKPPTDWVHYLGRALWAQGKRPEAIRNLKDAFDRQRSNLLYAHWLYHAYLAEDDLHEAIGVCRRLGEAGQYAAAVEGIQAILKKWPVLRIEDLAAGKRTPHNYLGWEGLGDIAYRQKNFRTAVFWYRMARRTEPRHAKRWAGWALVACRQWDQAERMFRGYVRIYAESYRDSGRLGLGCALLGKGQWAEADKAFAAITRKSWADVRDTGRLWAALGAGGRPARARPDPYTLLGMIRASRQGAGRGESVLFIVPASPLARARPAVRRGDVVLRVGEAPLGTAPQQAALRKGTVPAGVVKVRVRRGSHRFDVEVDCAAALKLLPPASAPVPATKEARP